MLSTEIWDRILPRTEQSTRWVGRHPPRSLLRGCLPSENSDENVSLCFPSEASITNPQNVPKVRCCVFPTSGKYLALEHLQLAIGCTTIRSIPCTCRANVTIMTKHTGATKHNALFPLYHAFWLRSVQILERVWSLIAAASGFDGRESACWVWQASLDLWGIRRS